MKTLETFEEISVEALNSTFDEMSMCFDKVREELIKALIRYPENFNPTHLRMLLISGAYYADTLITLTKAIDVKTSKAEKEKKDELVQ